MEKNVAWTTIGVFIKTKGKEKVYTKKTHNRSFSVLFFLILRDLHGQWYLKCVLTLTFHDDRFLTYGILCFSIFITDVNYTRMLLAILNKSWRPHPKRHQLYGHLPPITKTIQVRRTRHAGHCWRSRDELIRDVLLWTPTHGREKAGRPARTYIQQLCEDTGCCPEDLPRAMNDRGEWRERVRDIRATSATWWWWWWWLPREYEIKMSCCHLVIKWKTTEYSGQVHIPQ